jgi:hypothetical protein
MDEWANKSRELLLRNLVKGITKMTYNVEIFINGAWRFDHTFSVIDPRRANGVFLAGHIPVGMALDRVRYRRAPKMKPEPLI